MRYGDRGGRTLARHLLRLLVCPRSPSRHPQTRDWDDAKRKARHLSLASRPVFGYRNWKIGPEIPRRAPASLALDEIPPPYQSFKSNRPSIVFSDLKVVFPTS